jgi:hypothetical protein
MRPLSVLALLRTGVLDPGLAGLAWLLVEGGVPVVVIGSAGSPERSAMAGALLAIDPARAFVVLDADVEAPTLARLAALLRGGAGVGITLAAADLPEAMERLRGEAGGLPDDAIRRLGTVFALDGTSRGPRCSIVHYLRPTERDGQGHVQRRPPAILAAWDEASASYEDYAWAVTPELADRVDRSQADFEERLRGRAALLAATSRATHISAGEWQQRVRHHPGAEPPRERAPQPPSAPPPPGHGSPGAHRH